MNKQWCCATCGEPSLPGTQTAKDPEGCRKCGAHERWEMWPGQVALKKWDYANRVARGREIKERVGELTEEEFATLIKSLGSQ